MSHPIEFDSSNNAGASASQGRAKRGRAVARRTLDGPQLSAGDIRASQNQSIDFALLKRVVSLALVLSRYGVLAELKKVGSQLAGPCPIHNGSDPRQFVVHLASHNWFCFSPQCNRGGSVLEFVALKERVDISRAAQLIAEWFAIGPPRHLPPRPRLQRSKSMNNSKPSHRVFIVEDVEGDQPDQKGFWTQIGSAWPHKDGKGLNMQLKPGIAVSGRVVLREWTEDEQRTKTRASK
jgi:CHC2-type zinc finger protein